MIRHDHIGIGLGAGPWELPIRNSLFFVPRGKSVAMRSRVRERRLWPESNWSPRIAELESTRSPDPVRAASWSPNGVRIGRLYLFERAKKRVCKLLICQPVAAVHVRSGPPTIRQRQRSSPISAYPVSRVEVLNTFFSFRQKRGERSHANEASGTPNSPFSM